MTYIWKLTWLSARGAHWEIFKECNNRAAKNWLTTLQRQEPDAIFKIASRRPPLTTELVAKITPS